MITYGLISQVDARCLEKTIDLLCEEFPTQEINITEVGVNEWRTAKGVIQYVKSKGKFPIYTGIDNFSDAVFEIPVLPDIKFIEGNSSEVYNQISDCSQHFIIIDANHSLPCVIQDFYCYADKVRLDGFLAFHDVGKHIKKFKDYQRIGSTDDEDMYISVRRALIKIGLFENKHWELVFDEADPNDEAGGFSIFKKR